MTYIQKHITNKEFLCDKLQSLFETHIFLPSMPGNPTLRKIWVALSLVKQYVSAFLIWDLQPASGFYSLSSELFARFSWVCLAFFPFNFKTASDPVLITIMSQSCIMRPDLSHIFWFDFSVFPWVVLGTSLSFQQILPLSGSFLTLYVFLQLYLSHIISETICTWGQQYLACKMVGVNLGGRLIGTKI